MAYFPAFYKPQPIITFCIFFISPMAFGVKFIPLKPLAAAQLPSRRGSLVDVTNASAPFSSEEANKAM